MASQNFSGIVVSDKMDKTVVVEVRQYKKHPKYGKYLVIRKKYKVHDPKNSAKIGDKVTIKPSRPISKDKHFALVEGAE
jgi:small subunit ribosomal protein S17